MTRTAGRDGSPPSRDAPDVVGGRGGDAVLTGALPRGQGRDAVLAEVRTVMDAVVAPRATVVLAVSGGPDSTALAFLVTEARPDLVACVAHIRHGLRDDAADAEVAAAHAAALGVAYHERSVQVRPSGRGVEAAAREARYAALSRIAGAVGARALIVGHTAEDQAETVLLDIARGTGLRGLAGMAVSRPAEHDTDDDEHGMAATHGVRVVRPMLRLRREDVHAFVTGEGLRAVTDPTNRDPQQRRGQVRHSLLPALAALSGGTGDPVGALTRLADLARADADALDELAAVTARRSVVAWGPGRAVRTADLSRLPRALAGRVVRLLLRAVWAGPEVPAASVSAVLALEPGQAVHTPGGVWVTCGSGWLAAVPPGLPPLADRPLPVPGTVVLPELGLAVHADRGDPAAGCDPGPDDGSRPPVPGPVADPPPGAERAPWTLRVVDEACDLVVRGRRAGDRIGTARLTDLLSDAGLPRALRDLVPVVAGPEGRVVWVPGVDAAPSRPAAGAVVRLWLAPAP